MEAKKYAVVVFTDEDGVSLVSSNWCSDGKTCYWPPYKSPVQFQKAVMANEKPTPNWTTHAVRILSTTDSYDEGRMLSIRAEETSDLQSDAECPPKRRRRINRRYVSSDDDDDEDTTSSLVDAPAAPVPRETSTSMNREPSFTPSPSPSQASPGPIIPSQAPATHQEPSTSSQPSHASPARNITIPSTPSPTQRRVSPPASRSSAHSPHDAGSRNSQAVGATNRLVLTLLTQLKTEIREIKDQVRTNTALLQRLSDSRVEEEEELDLPQEIQLPVSSVDELKTLDDAIKADKVLQKHLIRRVSVLGDATLKECVKRVMLELMCNAVATKLNWTGASGKSAFSNLALKDVVEKSVRKNHPTEKATSSEIQGAIVRFLKGASDRDGGRRARPAAASAEDDA